MFKNVDKFREAAVFFDKNKRYDDGIKDSKYYNDFWDREFDRCLNGYTVNNVSIPGRYYWYLNFCPILLVTKNKKGGVGKRERKFPKFWDEDYKYYWGCEIARNGIGSQEVINTLKTDEDIYAYRLKELARLNSSFDLGIVDTPENLAGGHHMVWVKGRGVGASFKGGSNAAYNYFLVRESNSFLIANDKAFLEDDGLWTKTIEYVDFINANTAFAKGSEYINDRRNMHIRASFKTGGNESGYLTDIIGVTLKNNIEGARGKRGDIFWEEAGKFPKLDVGWNIARKSVEEDGVVFGLMIAFGTSGVEKANFESLEKMFYEPDTFNCLKYYNIWDENRIDNQCCLFTPAYMSLTYMDEDGNTNQEEAKKFFEKERLKKLKSSDPSQIDAEKVEKPFSPSEAFMNVENNIFPAGEIKNWITTIKTSPERLHSLGTSGYFDEVNNILKFKPDINLKPVLDFPIKPNIDITGCPVIFQSPYRDKDGLIPSNLYVICVDPYGSETQGGTNKKSLGSVYVLKNVNNISRPDDCIVASYIGRPNDMQIFHKNLFNMAIYYNAKICFESDRGEAILTYAKLTKNLKWLMEELSLGFNESIPKATIKRSYGMHMGSGKNNPRKIQGDTYLNEWLRRLISMDEDGKSRHGYHQILDLGALEEFSRYNGVDNYDRISALRVGIYAMQEISYKQLLKNNKESKKTAKLLLDAEFFT